MKRSSKIKATMYKFGIVCLLPEEINQYHLKLRQALSTRFNIDDIARPKIPAHITMKYPYPVKNHEEIEKLIRNFSLSQVKSECVLQGFGYFKKTDGHVIFIDVHPGEEMRRIHSNLLKQLHKIDWISWGQFDNAQLHYHVTLAAHGITQKKFLSIWSFLEQLGKPHFEVCFDNLSLIKITDESRFVHRSFWFQNK